MSPRVRVVLGAIALQIVWLPLWEYLRDRPGWMLGAVLCGPWLLACAALLAESGNGDGVRKSGNGDGVRKSGNGDGARLLACGVLLAGDARARRARATLLAVLLLAMDLAFELWVPAHWRVATMPWQLVRLGVIAPAALFAPLFSGRCRPFAWLGQALVAGSAAVAVTGFVVCLRGAARTTARSADAAIVLGTALDARGHATPSLVARVRHAADLWRRGLVGTLLLTGGPGRRGPAESAAADVIARRAGLPSEALLREERSGTTWQNMLEAARIARRMRWRSVLVVTEPFHMGRAMILARAAGLPAPRPSVSRSPLWNLRAAPYWAVREVAHMPAALVRASVGPPRDRPPREAQLELYETAPAGTSLSHDDLRDASVVWSERLARAKRSIDVAQFYASSRPGSPLEPVIAGLEAAADRGVRVRFLAEASFDRVYPDTLARLEAHRGIQVRRLDFSKLAGGIVHAKYFVIDREEVLLGSQNFDWRALTHIQELGVRVSNPAIARALADVFATDWAFAGGADPAFRAPPSSRDQAFPRGLALVASPRGWLPDESLWDLPHILSWIGSAGRTIELQLLTFEDEDGDRRWAVLADALHRAVARGVKVRILVSSWVLAGHARAAIARLHAPPGSTVRIVSIPVAPEGFIPFARVVHAKYMVVDRARAWIGTSNFGKDYFLESRNVGLLVDRGTVARRLAAFFEGTWSSTYAETFDPHGRYPAPRIAE